MTEREIVLKMIDDHKKTRSDNDVLNDMIRKIFYALMHKNIISTH